MREIVHLQAGQCGNQIGAKVREILYYRIFYRDSQISASICALMSRRAIFI